MGALFIRGPRQTGKSSLLEKMVPLAQSHIYLDDIHLQKRAEEDPRMCGENSLSPASFRLTGSNQGLIDSSVKETLAGRVSIFYLLGLL